MEYGNVLVIGSAGVGKSTLIKAVLGPDETVTTDAKGRSREHLEIHESLSVPFRIIDAHDIGSSLLARHGAIRAVKAWSKDNALDGDETNDIHVIWFCIEGKSRKLVRQQLADLSRATDVWRSVPVIVVLTKSYAALEREANVALVRQTFARTKRRARNLRAVIPVVAETYQLDETTFVAPEGIPQLIEATNDAMPEGVRAAGTDIASFSLKRRRSVARSIIAASAAAGVTVGAVPLPISDALILTPIETGLINGLATLYGINKGSTSKKLINTMLEVGTVSTAARAAISALKAVPGINLGASVLNAAIAGSVVAAIGEGSMRVFERIYLGEKTLDDTEWVRSFMESSLSKELATQGTNLLGKVSGTGSSADQRKAIVRLLKTMIDARGERQAAQK